MKVFDLNTNTKETQDLLNNGTSSSSVQMSYLEENMSDTKLALPLIFLSRPKKEKRCFPQEENHIMIHLFCSLSI